MNAFSFCKVMPPSSLKNLPKRKYRAVSLKSFAGHLYFIAGKKKKRLEKAFSHQAAVGEEGRVLKESRCISLCLTGLKNISAFWQRNSWKSLRHFFHRYWRAGSFAFAEQMSFVTNVSFLIEIDISKNSHFTNSGGSSILNGMIKNPSFSHCFVFHLRLL